MGTIKCFLHIIDLKYVFKTAKKMEIGWKRVMDIVKILARKVCTQIFFSFLITKVLINSFKTNKKHHPKMLSRDPP